MISLIVAMDLNRVIGVDNQLPWRLPADLKRFKDLTMNHHIVMGRKTFESIGKPLPGRTSVIITRQTGYRAPDGCKVAHGLSDAIEAAKDDPEIFIIGGAEIFEQALPLADRLYLTEVQTRVPRGDTWFPAVDRAKWRVLDDASHVPDEKNPFAYRFITLERSR